SASAGCRPRRRQPSSHRVAYRQQARSGPHHHDELAYQAVLVVAKQIDTLDVTAVDRGGEKENLTVILADLPLVREGRCQDLAHRAQKGCYRGPSLVGLEHNRTSKVNARSKGRLHLDEILGFDGGSKWAPATAVHGGNHAWPPREAGSDAVTSAWPPREAGTAESTSNCPPMMRLAPRPRVTKQNHQRMNTRILF